MILKQLIRLGRETATPIANRSQEPREGHHMLKSIFTHSTALNVISKLKSDTKGSIAPMFAISATMLVMGLACAVDMSSAFHSKSRLQDITDSISLSAAKSGIEGQGELMTLANNYLASHYSADELATVTINSIVRSEDTVTVNATNIVDTNFAQIFGQDNLNVTTESSSTISQSAIDLAFVLDTTGSMSGSKINTLKVAANRCI